MIRLMHVRIDDRMSSLTLCNDSMNLLLREPAKHVPQSRLSTRRAALLDMATYFHRQSAPESNTFDNEHLRLDLNVLLGRARLVENGKVLDLKASYSTHGTE